MRYSTPEEFGVRLAELLQLELPDEIGPYDDLYNDWGLDSLQAFQMVIITEAMAECLVPPAAIPDIYTLRDAFNYYQLILEVGTR